MRSMSTSTKLPIPPPALTTGTSRTGIPAAATLASDHTLVASSCGLRSPGVASTGSGMGAAKALLRTMMLSAALTLRPFDWLTLIMSGGAGKMRDTRNVVTWASPLRFVPTADSRRPHSSQALVSPARATRLRPSCLANAAAASAWTSSSSRLRPKLDSMIPKLTVNGGWLW